MTMESDMARVVVGQHEAVSAICKALRRSRARFERPATPIGTFALLGPTGVGKTLLAKITGRNDVRRFQIADQLDMSEYMERTRFAHGRLAAGYVGYEEGGQLTEQSPPALFSDSFRRNRERPHPDVRKQLLPVRRRAN